MKTSLFDYTYSKAAIAQEPLRARAASRLLVLDRKTGETQHRSFFEIGSWLQAGDILVLNDTKVLPMRLCNGMFEVLLLSISPPTSMYPCLIHPQRSARVGMSLTFSSHLQGRIVKVADDGPGLIELTPSAGEDLISSLERSGLPPLPPYIKRKKEDARTPTDRARYQTVYASAPGSAAAPTAGFHFTDDLLGSLAAQGVEITKITLHVGWDTFRPVRVDEIEKHPMHGESYSIRPESAAAINRAKKEGRRVVAVGTTTVRCLESAWDDSTGLCAGRRTTHLLVTPGYPFKVVDALITNFHQPRSTLLALVCAFAGRERILAAYQEAIARGYRLFSYGDAMFIV